MSQFVMVIEFIKQVALLITACAGLKSSRQKLKLCRDRKNKKKYARSHKIIASVYPILHEVLNEHEEIDHVAILKSHNGDGIPKPGTVSYTTYVQEVWNHKVAPCIEKWQRIPSDEEMTHIIGDLITDKVSHIKVGEPKGILTDYCVGNGIKSVFMVPIETREDGFLFLNFCSTSSEDLSEVEGIQFEAASCASRISKLYFSESRLS